jgi:hypothetical protein
LTTNHEKFLSHLKKSDNGVWSVARWLHGRGHNVKINCSPQAPSADQWKKYADNGDLEISLRVEVKQLSADFTGEGDWPFRNKFIVCAKHSWDNSQPKPYAYIYLNKEGSHAAIVMGHTSKTWGIEKKIDSRYDNVEQEFYMIHPSKAYWMEIIS